MARRCLSGPVAFLLAGLAGVVIASLIAGLLLFTLPDLFSGNFALIEDFSVLLIVASFGLAFSLPTTFAGLAVAVMLEMRRKRHLPKSIWALSGALFATPTALLFSHNGTDWLRDHLHPFVSILLAGAGGSLMSRRAWHALQSRWSDRLDTCTSDMAQGGS